MDKLKTFFRHSLTVLWARLLVVVGIFTAVFADPTMLAALQQKVPPHEWPYVLIAIGLLTEIFRSRTLGVQ